MADSTGPSPSATYAGSCHCGAVNFSATISPGLESGHEVTDCNCSICTRNGYYLVYTPKSAVSFTSGFDSLRVRSHTLSAARWRTRLSRLMEADLWCAHRRISLARSALRTTFVLRVGPACVLARLIRISFLICGLSM